MCHLAGIADPKHTGSQDERPALAFSRMRWAPSVQFCSSMVIVMGPTPPGTGVMKPAFSFTSLKATSPTSL